MFFIGVFGIEDKQIEIKILSDFECKVCSVLSTARVIKKYTYFHFFFIPLLKWNESYYVTCDKCKSVYSIPKEKGKYIENSENVDITYWDLEEVFSGNSNDETYGNNVCRSCGKNVDKSYKYCPYCGQRMR